MKLYNGVLDRNALIGHKNKKGVGKHLDYDSYDDKRTYSVK